MILIRADGSEKVGAGHLMRCMTVAEKLVEKDSVFFLTSSPESVKMVEERGFQAACLQCYQAEKTNSEITDLTVELTEMADWIRKKKPRWVVVDSYQVNEEYLGFLSERTSVAYFDDSGEKPYPVDLIINYNVYAQRSAYETLYKGRSTAFLAGADYIPLRSGFTQVEYCVQKEMKHILLLTGGGDYFGLAGKFMKALGSKKEFRDFRFHLICGYFNEQKEKLKEEALKYGNFFIYENVSDIWNLMRKCDLAITAGGTTVYELCAVGVPLLGYSFADNQRPVLSFLHQNEIAPDCGDFRDTREKMFAQMTEYIWKYQNSEVRKQASQKGKQLVDGQGAGRIAEALVTCYNKI